MLKRIIEKIHLWLVLRDIEKKRKAYSKRPYYGVERRKRGSFGELNWRGNDRTNYKNN